LKNKSTINFRFHKRYLLIFLLFFPYVIFGAGWNREDLSLQYFQSLPDHYWNGFKRIADWDQHKYVLLTGVILLPLALPLDHPIQDRIENHKLFADPVSRVGDAYGEFWGYAGAGVAITITGLLKHQPLRRTAADAILLGETIGTTAVFSEALKRIVSRRRPNGNRYSFPSGHTAGSFALAATLQEIYGKTVGIPAYAMAWFVAATRMNDDKHYLSDVVAGAVLGTVIGRSFAAQHAFEWNAECDRDRATLSLSIPF